MGGGGVRYLLPGFFVKKMYGAAEQKCTWHVARVVLRVFYLVFFFVRRNGCKHAALLYVLSSESFKSWKYIYQTRRRA